MPASPKFTIVTPAYESAPYIAQMVASLKAQTLQDFECLLMVEESRDNSLARCQELAQDDPRFHVFSLPKSGSGSASYNYGIRHASAPYVVFVDGDDWIEPQSLERFAKAIDDCGGLDLLLASGRELFQRKDGSFQVTRRISNVIKADEDKVFTGQQLIVKVGRAQNYQVLNICRTDFLRSNQLYFVDGLQQEDTEWTPRVWFHASRVAMLDFEFYNYRRQPSSVQSSCSTKLLMDLAKVVTLQFDFQDTHEIPEAVLQVWQNQWVSMVYWYFFHPQYARRFSPEVRTAALDLLMGDEAKWQRFHQVASRTSLPKRIALPLVKRAALKHDFRWADRFFGLFYFPFIKLLRRHD